MSKPKKSQSGRAAKPKPARFKTASIDGALGFRLKLLDAVIAKSFAAHFDAFDITPVLFSLLVLIKDNPGARQVDLSEALGMHESNLVQQFGALLRRGLIQRHMDPSDRRAKILSLTEQGSHLTAKLTAAHGAHVKRIKALLGARAHDRLLELMTKTLAKASSTPL